MTVMRRNADTLNGFSIGKTMRRAKEGAKKAADVLNKPASVVSDGISALNTLLNPKKPSAALPAGPDEGIMSKIMSPMGIGITVAIFGGIMLLKKRRALS